MVRGAERDRAVLIVASGRMKAGAKAVPERAEAARGASNPEFRHQLTKDGTVFVFWRGRRVRTFTGRDAERLLARLEGLDTEGRQMVFAKATGNFKRGNERR